MTNKKMNDDDLYMVPMVMMGVSGMESVREWKRIRGKMEAGSRESQPMSGSGLGVTAGISAENAQISC